MPGDDTVECQVFALLRDEMYLDVPEADTDLIAEGFIDSAAFVRLFVLLEDTFDIAVETGDLRLDAFRTVAAISGFVTGKKEASRS